MQEQKRFSGSDLKTRRINATVRRRDGSDGDVSDGAMAQRCDGDGATTVRALPHCGARKTSNFGKEGQMKLPGWKRLRPASRDSE